MTFLTLNGTTFDVRSNAAQQTYDYHGLDRQRMFDGTMREIRRGIFRKWSCSTKFKNQADYLALLAILETENPPLTASGDLMDGATVYVHPVILSASPTQSANGFVRQIAFELYETFSDVGATLTPWLFLRSGAGWYKDLDKTEAATNNDHARVWADSSGHARDAITRYDDADPDFTLIPQVQQSGTAVRFGDPAYTNGDIIGPTTRRGAYVLPSVTGFSAAEIMISLRAAGTPESDDVGAPLMQITGSTNGEDFFYKASDGHIWSTFGSNNNYDVGAPGINLTARFHVINIVSSADVWRYSLDGETRLEDTSTPDPAFNGSTAVIGERATASASLGMWNGWFKHVVLFNQVLTDAQRAAWYAFVNGDTDEAPLPP